MQIAILGTGNVGGALGRGWAAAGHGVIFGTRDPGSAGVAELLAEIGEAARAVGTPEAAAAAEVVVLATPWAATRGVIDDAGDLGGKILVDCTNPLTPDISALTLGHDRSAGELVAEWAPGVRVVKAFNTTGANNMADAAYAEARPWMPVCGDDAEAKAVVMELAGELGFEAVDVGPLDGARLTEPLALLWIRLAYVQGLGREIAFALLRRQGHGS